jgi:hypothetical protein
LPPDDGAEEHGDKNACNWSSCLTTHSTPQALLTRWEVTHLLPLIALSQLQPQSQIQYLCLWSNSHETSKRPSDLDRHVQSIHLSLRFHCYEPDCDDNIGKWFARADRLKIHERGVHGLRVRGGIE